MKKLLFVISIYLFSGCSDYQIVDTTIFKGVVSDKDVIKPAYRMSGYCTLYIQDSKQTKKVNIPYENRDEYNIGDTAIIVIQRVR